MSERVANSSAESASRRISIFIIFHVKDGVCCYCPLLLCCCLVGFVLVHLPQTEERLNSCEPFRPRRGTTRDEALPRPLYPCRAIKHSSQPHKHRYFDARSKRVNKQIAQVYIMGSRCVRAIATATQEPINGFYYSFSLPSIRVSIEIIIIFHALPHPHRTPSTEMAGPRNPARFVCRSTISDH